MKTISWDELKATEEKARTGGRGRAMHVIHEQDADPLQRMINIMTPDTYVTPHKHENPDKRELFVCLKGAAVAVEFDEGGALTHAQAFSAHGPVFAVEIPPRTWHSFICRADSTYLLEIKDGPYDPATDKQFAPWAPREGDARVQNYLQKLRTMVKDDD